MKKVIFLFLLMVSLFLTSCVEFGYRTSECYDCGCTPDFYPCHSRCVPACNMNYENQANRVLMLESPDGTKIYIDNSTEVYWR